MRDVSDAEFDLPDVGSWSEGRLFTVDPERLVAYARAVDDPAPDIAGWRVNPVFAVVPALESIRERTLTVVPPAMWPSFHHSGHYFEFHRNYVPGIYSTKACVVSLTPCAAGVEVVTRAITINEAGREVTNQYHIGFVGGASIAGPVGPRWPVAPPMLARGSLAHSEFSFGLDQSYRYAGATGDSNPVHVDGDAARRVGMPGVVLQRTCTLAKALGSFAGMFGGPEPRMISTLAARFGRWVTPGEKLSFILADGGNDANGTHTYGFEGFSATGIPSLSLGRLSLSSQGGARYGIQAADCVGT